MGKPKQIAQKRQESSRRPLPFQERTPLQRCAPLDTTTEHIYSTPMKEVPLKNPPNPWHSSHVEWIGEPPEQALKVYETRARRIISHNNSPDVPFDYGLNPYQGCTHACAYCYARPTHEYLDFGAGSDFERRIFVKTNAPERLRAELRARSWKRGVIVFSGNTDCYQPLEAHYELTRQCLEICAAYRNPVGVITKGALIRRDVDVLRQIHDVAAVKVWISVAFADDTIARKIEPGTTTIPQRFKTIEILAEAGIPVGVSLSPIIIGLNDVAIPEILKRAADAGAIAAFMTPLRLPGSVQEVFENRLQAAFPDRFNRVMNGLRDIRRAPIGEHENRFHERMKGYGPRWNVIRNLFETQAEQHGLLIGEGPMNRVTKIPDDQLSLF